MKSKPCKTTSQASKPARVVKKVNKAPKKAEEPKVNKEMRFIKQLFCLIGGTLLLIAMCMLLLVVVSGCTYSCTNVQTEGQASDVVDETQTNDPEVEPSLQFPLKI